MVLVVLMIPILMTSCTTSVSFTDSAATLNYVRIDDVSCLSRGEKEDLTYNKCLIRKAKYGKFSKACKKLMDL